MAGFAEGLSKLLDKKKEKKVGEQESPDVAEGQEGESAGDSMGDAAMASGNPYAMAAGAAMKVIGARAKRQKERTAALTSSVNQQQQGMSKGAASMANVASGFRL